MDVPYIASYGRLQNEVKPCVVANSFALFFRIKVVVLELLLQVST